MVTDASRVNLRGESLAMDYLKSLFSNMSSVVASTIVASLTSYWQTLPEALHGALIGAVSLLVADTFLGMMRGAKRKRFSSCDMSKFFHKTGIYMGVTLAAYGVDQVFRTGYFAQTIVVFMVCFREFTSVVENSTALGFKWPKLIIDRMDAMREEMCETPTKPTKKEETKNDHF